MNDASQFMHYLTQVIDRTRCMLIAIRLGKGIWKFHTFYVLPLPSKTCNVLFCYTGSYLLYFSPYSVISPPTDAKGCGTGK